MSDQEQFHGPTLYTVGKPYSKTKKHWPEAYDYNYRQGHHEIRVFLRTPHPREIEAVKGGQAKFSFATFGIDYLFLSFVFMAPDGAGALSADCSYHIALVSEDERTPPKMDFPPDMGAPLTIFLVDAENGILKAMRVIGMGHKFTLKLHAAITKQIGRPLPDDYTDRLKSILARYTTADLLNKRRTAIYTAGSLEG